MIIIIITMKIKNNKKFTKIIVITIILKTTIKLKKYKQCNRDNISSYIL